MTKSLQPIILDSGKLWEVYNELPPGVLGGTPVVLIDKATCKVFSSVHEQ